MGYLEWEFGFVEEGEKPYGIGRLSFYFARDILKFVKEIKHESIFHSLFDQLVRSATSIGANIIEGKAGSSRKIGKSR